MKPVLPLLSNVFREYVHDAGELSLFNYIMVMVLAVPYFIIGGVNIVIIVRRRNHPFLQKQSFILLMLVQLGYLFAMFSIFIQSVVGPQRSPCFVMTWFILCSIPAVFSPHLLRMIRLFLLLRTTLTKQAVSYALHDAFHSQNTSSSLSSSSSSSSPTGSRSIERQQDTLRRVVQWVSHKALFGEYIGILLIVNIIYMLTLIAPSIRKTTDCEGPLLNILTAVDVVIHITALLLMTVVIRNVKDEFNVKRSVVTSVFIWIASVVLYAAGAVIPSYREYINPYWSYVLWLILGIWTDTGVSMVWPVVNSFRKGPYSARRAGTTDLDGCYGEGERNLDSTPITQLRWKVMNVFHHDPQEKQLFEQYCRQELSVESFFFLKDCESLKSISSKETKIEYARLLYDTYIAPEAPVGNNMPHSIILQVKNDVEDEIYQNTDEEETSRATDTHVYDIFSDARHQAHANLMDIGMRYLRSNLYQQFLKQREMEKEVVDRVFNV